MRHSAIALVALTAALSASRRGDLAPDRAITAAEYQLYEYARSRGFPHPETLARKHCALMSIEFSPASLDECPEEMRAFYITFRAVAEALELLHEPDPEKGDDEIDAIRVWGIDNETSKAPAFGTSSNDLPAGGDAPAAAVDAGNAVASTAPALADPVPVVGAAGDSPPAQTVEERPSDPAPDQVDEIEVKREELQAQTDEVIAESGGTFSGDKSKKKTK